MFGFAWEMFSKKGLCLSAVDNRCVAYHEAGHYVVANAIGLRTLGKPSLGPIKNEAGQVEVLGHGGGLEANWFAGDEILKDRARSHVVAMYAGAAAEIRFGGDPEDAPLGAQDDDAMASYRTYLDSWRTTLRVSCDLKLSAS